LKKGTPRSFSQEGKNGLIMLDTSREPLSKRGTKKQQKNKNQPRMQRGQNEAAWIWQNKLKSQR